jgi:hypothetical protein
MHRSKCDLPTNGYALIVDGKVKTEFATKEGAEKGAFDLKQRFPMLQIGIYDAEAKRAETVRVKVAGRLSPNCLRRFRDAIGGDLRRLLGT